MRFIMTPWAGPGLSGGPVQQPGTFMHELGHNFALDHSGLAGEPNYEPIYPSVMNYRWQFGLTDLNAVWGFVDYSNIDLNDIDEEFNMVNEATSYDSPEPVSVIKYYVEWDCPVFMAMPFALPDDPMFGGQSKDWNCVGGFGFANAPDITGDGSKSLLAGFDDWEYLEAGGLRFSDYVVNYADGAGGRYSEGELGGEEAAARGVLLARVFPSATLAPGCSTQSSLSGRRIPLVVYGTATFDAAEIVTASRAVWNGASPVAGYTFDVNSDGYTDWIGHYSAPGVAVGAGSSWFTAQLASSQLVLAKPAVTFGTVGDGDGDKIDNNCDACPTVAGSGRFGCP